MLSRLFLILSSPMGRKPSVLGARNVIAFIAFIISSASAHVNFFGSLLRSKCILFATSSSALSPNLSNSLFRKLEIFLASVYFERLSSSSTVAPLGWGFISFGLSGSSETVRLNIIFLPVGSLKEIFAWGFATAVLRRYSYAFCSACLYRTPLNSALTAVPLKSFCSISILLNFGWFVFVSIVISVANGFPFPEPVITLTGFPVVICANTVHPLLWQTMPPATKL